MRLILAGRYRIGFLSTVMAWGRVRADSATRRYSHFQAHFYIYRKYLDAFRLYGIAEEELCSMIRIHSGNEMVVKEIQQGLSDLLPDTVVERGMSAIQQNSLSKRNGNERKDETNAP